MPDRLIKGRYRLLETLGRGGVATVYLAHDGVLDRIVAVKILDERLSRDVAFIERFNREAKAAAGIRHPNIVQIFDTGCDGESHFIVMERVEGATMKELLDSGPIEPAMALRYAVQIARALSHAHRSNIIHRDVKPANIIVEPDGVVKIADFGIARALDAPGITQTGKVLGTAEYLSPEQASGRAADERSDIYAFGVVFYEMLVGEPPFRGKNPVEVAARHVTEVPRGVDEFVPVSPELARFVARLLSKRPEERLASFDEVVEELGAIEEEEPPRHSYLPASSTRRAILASTATIAAFLGVLAVFIYSAEKPVERAVQPGPRIPVQTPTAIEPIKLSDYDPEGNGTEKRSEVKLTIDGRRGTAWYTEGYENEKLGNLKSGVGLIADFGAPRRMFEINVRSLAGGWSAQIKGSNDAKSWRVLSEASSMKMEHTFKIKGEYRYYLLWITKLTRLPEREGYRVAIDEIVFKG